MRSRRFPIGRGWRYAPEATFDDMVRMDIRYSNSWSFWLDLKLLFKTPVSVFIGKGAC